MNFLTTLDRDIEIVGKKPRSRKSATIAVRESQASA